MANSISQSVPVLQAVWRLVQRGASLHVEGIARESQLTPARIREHLRTLVAAQLLDPHSHRLTLHGLALAVAYSRSKRQRSPARRAALPRVMLPVVSFRAPRPANVTGIADAGRV